MRRLFGKSKEQATNEGQTTRATRASTSKRAAEAGKGKQREGESSRQREESGPRPEDFGFSLIDKKQKEKFQKLCHLPHKQCRFQDMEAMTRMGIADDVLAMAHNVGIAPLFQANHFAYKRLTVEFLSTVEVTRQNGIPRAMIFQLGGRFHAMTADTLNEILQGPANGAYTGNHDILPHEFWGHIAPTDTGVYRDFTAMGAKASWVRNPAIRYFHRLLSTGLLSRMDDGTFQSNELHLVWAALHREPQHLGCYLMEHFHSQSQAFSAKISVGGMITPIAIFLGISIDEEPISRDIFLDRRALKQRHMLLHDRNPRTWLWIIHQNNGKFTFPLPNQALTHVMGEDRITRWQFKSPAHLALMRRIPARNRQGLPIEDDEQEEEEAEYEQGGEQPHHEEAQAQPQPRHAPFHMRAPDFEGFEQRYYSHSDGHHNEQMAAHDNYYMLHRQFTEEQVGLARQETADFRQEVSTTLHEVVDNQRAMMDILQRMHGSWPWYPPHGPPPPPQ